MQARRCTHFTFLAAPIITLALSLAVNHTYAAGYAIDVASSSALGNSYAGQATGAHDLGDMFINPAAINQFNRQQRLFNNMLLDYSIKVGPGATAQAATGASTDLVGDASQGTDAGATIYVPAAYFSQPLSSKTTLGLGISTPWGLKSTYPNQWIGRYQSTGSEVRSVNFTPVIGYKIQNNLSVAGGIQIQYLQAALSSAIDFGSIGAAFNVPGFTGPDLALDGIAKVKGDGWGYGYHVGLIYQPTDTTRLGIAYRSKVHHNLSGKADFTVPAEAAALTAGGAFADTTIKTNLTTPERLSFGWLQQLSDRWEWVMDASYTRWSRAKSITIDYANTAQTDDSVIFDWKNNWLISTGVNYRYQKNMILRAGVGHEGSPVTQKYFGPSIPTPNQYVAAIGGSYQFSDRFTVDLNYMHQFFERGYSSLASDPANPFRGSLNASYDLSLDALTADFRWDF